MKNSERGSSAQRARFEALRSRMFEEVGRQSVRWRIVWAIPLQLLLVTTLIIAKASPVHVSIQAAIAAASVLLFALHRWAERRTTMLRRELGAAIGFVLYVFTVLNTGGLASPMLATGLPILLAAATHPALVMHRRRVLGILFFTFVVMAALSHSRFAELPAPFAFEADRLRPSTSYVLIAFVGCISTAVAVFQMGRTMSAVYENVAIEIAARREEVFSDGEERNRALEGIAARLAHEVRNPLSAIKALSLHVARNTDDLKVKGRLEIVSSEAERLQSIVDGFVSFSRGIQDLVVAEVKPYEVAQSLISLLELRAQEAGVSLSLSGDPDLSLQGDAKKLRQALLNLVLNAMHASPPGSTLEIRVVVSPPDGGLVHVIDHGAGMSAEIVSRIQKPYYTTKKGGSGLGVAVARSIIEQHGGKLSFESTVGVGTTATVHLVTNVTPHTLL
jgi:two-component system, NtrC family, sensor histidine kinase HydH